jgi:hypothetical protein
VQFASMYRTPGPVSRPRAWSSRVQWDDRCDKSHAPRLSCRMWTARSVISRRGQRRQGINASQSLFRQACLSARHAKCTGACPSGKRGHSAPEGGRRDRLRESAIGVAG